VQPFLDAWRNNPQVETYPAGSDGPVAADTLLASDGREWRNIDA
jgi:glucose-6-phosphate 1-dehydrogenase